MFTYPFHHFRPLPALLYSSLLILLLISGLATPVIFLIQQLARYPRLTRALCVLRRDFPQHQVSELYVIPVGRPKDAGFSVVYESRLPERIRGNGTAGVTVYVRCYFGEVCREDGCERYVKFWSNRPRVDWESVVVYSVWIGLCGLFMIVCPVLCLVRPSGKEATEMDWRDQFDVFDEY